MRSDPSLLPTVGASIGVIPLSESLALIIDLRNPFSGGRRVADYVCG